MKKERRLLFTVLFTSRSAQDTIRLLLKTSHNHSLQTAMEIQLQRYQFIEREARAIATSRGWDMASARNAQPISAWRKLRILNSQSNSKAAEKIIETCTRNMIHCNRLFHAHNYQDERVLFLFQRMIDCEYDHIQQMQRFL